MKRLLYLLLSFIACLCVWVSPAVAQEISPEVAAGLEAQVLGLSFDDLPAFEQGGFMLGYRDAIFQTEGQVGVDNFDANSEQYEIPYDPAREWIAGQFPSEVIKLGDLMGTGAGIEQLTMDGIGQLTGIDIENFQLADVPFLQNVTLSDLVGKVPFLGDYTLADLPNLAQQIGAADLDKTLGQLVLENSPVGQLPVVGDVLGTLQVADLPNLGAAKLGDLPDIGDDVVANVPGLSILPFGSFPGMGLVGGLIPWRNRILPSVKKSTQAKMPLLTPSAAVRMEGRSGRLFPVRVAVLISNCTTRMCRRLKAPGPVATG